MRAREIIIKVEEIKNHIKGIVVRKIVNKRNTLYVLFIPQLSDRENMSENIIKPLVQCEKKLTTEIAANSVIFFDDMFICNDIEKIEGHVLKGFSVIVIEGESDYIVANTLKIEKRNVSPPLLQDTLRGPKDAFTENIESNLSLIRYRIKDANLSVDTYSVGNKTKTSIAVVYLEDVANQKYVEIIKEKLNSINIDGIIESGYISKLISENTWDIFPKVSALERSDSACASILNGKICILVEGSNLSLVLPCTFLEFLDSGDDHYENIYSSVLTKILRYFTFFIPLFSTSIYIVIVSFNPDLLPAHYIIVLAISRVGVPVNTIVEVIIMEIVSEILREASLRLPKQIGPAIGIVGTIVIGEAAVSAGLVSPLTVIIISLSTMASFVAIDQSILQPFRVLKYLMIIFTGIFGIAGFVVGATVILIMLLSNTSFGVPYLAPLTPYNAEDLKDTILSDIRKDKRRPSYLNPEDKVRKS